METVYIARINGITMVSHTFGGLTPQDGREETLSPGRYSVCSNQTPVSRICEHSETTYSEQGFM